MVSMFALLSLKSRINEASFPRMTYNLLTAEMTREFYAKIKSASGQKSFGWDEEAHPRETVAHDTKLPGEFAVKVTDAIASPSVVPVIGETENASKSVTESGVPATVGVGQFGRGDASLHGLGGEFGFTGPKIVSLRQQTESDQAKAIKRVPERFQHSLTDAQKIGVGTAIKEMDEKGGLLLADGTGTGKTRQILAVAGHYAETGAAVVIVAPAEVLKPDWKKKTIAGSYAQDGAAMGVQPILTQGEDVIAPGSVYLTTYQNLEDVAKRMPPGSVFIADEAHALKNYGTKQNEAGQMAMERSKAVLYSTATPADKPTDLGYLFRAGVYSGMKAIELYPLLGMRQEDVWTGRMTVKKWTINPAVGARGVYERFGVLFSHLGDTGRMLKRELSWEGVPVESRDIVLPAGAHAELAQVADAAMRGKKNPGLARAASLMAQRGHAEKWKIPHAVEEAKRAISEGRQVVIFTARVSETKRDEGPTTLGTVGEVVKALAAEGINDVGVIAGGGAASSKKAMESFQSGASKVVVATIESGGTGINLDDTTGSAPRTTIFLTPPMSGTKYVQAAGRTWRQTTKSVPKILNLFADTEVDQWNKSLIEGKMKVLHALGGTQQHGVEYEHEISEEEAVMSFTERASQDTSAQKEAWRKRQDEAIAELKNRLGRASAPSQTLVASPVAPQPATTKPLGSVPSNLSATSAQQKTTPTGKQASATFTKLRSGDWGLRIEGDVKVGDTVTTRKRDGTSSQKKVKRIVWSGTGIHLAEMYERDRLEVKRYIVSSHPVTAVFDEAFTRRLESPA